MGRVLSSELRAGLEALAARRHGVVAQADLVQQGLRPDFAARAAAAGRWQRLLPGIYLTSAAAPTLRQRCHAALLHGGGEAVLTGAAGCQLRKLLLDVDHTVTIRVPRAVRVGSSGFCRVIATKTPPTRQLLRVTGRVDLPVADLSTCVADAIRGQSELNAARAVGLKAIRRNDLVWEDVVAAASRPGPGAGHLRRVVRDILDGVRSPAEADAHDAVLRAARRGQLPPYLLNPDVYLDGVLIGSPDLWVVGLGLGDEIDSREFHEGIGVLDATLRRHDRFQRCGLHLRHTTPARFHADPRAHVAGLRELVAERRRLERPEPPGLVVLARGPLLPERTPWPQVAPTRWA